MLTRSRVLALDAVARVTGELTPGVHLEAVSAGVPATVDEGQHAATHS